MSTLELLGLLQDVAPRNWTGVLVVAVTLLVYVAPRIREWWEEVAGLRVALETQRLLLERTKLRLEIESLRSTARGAPLSEVERRLLEPYEGPVPALARRDGLTPAQGSPALRSRRRWMTHRLAQAALGALGGTAAMGMLGALAVSASEGAATPELRLGLAMLTVLSALSGAVASLIVPGRGPLRSLVVGFLTPVALLVVLVGVT